MTVSETLEQTWKVVLTEASPAEGYYHRRIPMPSPWPAHAGIHRPTDTRILILETETVVIRAVQVKDESKGFSIDVSPDEGGRPDRASIRIEETSSVYREIFTIFCADILEHWYPHTSASDSIKSLLRRLARWKKFFQRGAPLGLSRENYIGLYGELSFMEAALNADASGLALANAWQAPLGTNQDYLFGPLAVEIKVTTGNEIDKIRITNARQLDSTGLQSLFLARYAFDFRQGSGRTLPQLVSALKVAFSTISPDALSIFSDRLLDAGLVEATTNEFDGWGFTPRQFDVFNIRDGFPRLLESSLPSGISEISYSLNLSAASAFQIIEADFWPLILSSHG